MFLVCTYMCLFVCLFIVGYNFKRLSCNKVLKTITATANTIKKKPVKNVNALNIPLLLQDVVRNNSLQFTLCLLLLIARL